MRKSTYAGLLAAGGCAGLVTGVFGAGGGMVLVPLLTALTPLTDDSIFPASITIILPICLTALAFTALAGTMDWSAAFPYLLGSAIGGFLAGKWGARIPASWLHRALGVLILWGGYRYLC